MLLAACSSSSKPATTAGSTGSAGGSGGGSIGTVNIGQLADETGNCSAPGVPTAKGVEMAVQQINQTPFTVGGKKYKINLTTVNTASSNTTAVADLQQLTQTDGAKIVIGPGCGAYVEPGLGPLAVKDGILLFNPYPTTQLDSDGPSAVSYANGEGFLLPVSQASSADTANAQAAMVKLLPDGSSIKSVYLLLENDEEGHTFGSTLGGYFKNNGYNLTLGYYPTTTQDFSGYLSAVKAAHPDILMYGYGDPSGLAILKQATAINAAPRYYGWGSALSDALGINGNNGISQEQLALVYPASLDYPRNARVQTFAQQYKAFNGGTLGDDSSYAAYLYDDPFLLVQAMEKAGTTTDLHAIAAALYGLHYNGLLSEDEHFDSTHHLRFNVDGCVVAPGPNPASNVKCTPAAQ